MSILHGEKIKKWNFDYIKYTSLWIWVFRTKKLIITFYVGKQFLTFDLLKMLSQGNKPILAKIDEKLHIFMI